MDQTRAKKATSEILLLLTQALDRLVTQRFGALSFEVRTSAHLRGQVADLYNHFHTTDADAEPNADGLIPAFSRPVIDRPKPLALDDLRTAAMLVHLHSWLAYRDFAETFSVGSPQQRCMGWILADAGSLARRCAEPYRFASECPEAAPC